MGKVRSSDLSDAVFLANTTMRVYVSFLNRQKYLAVESNLKQLTALPPSDSMADVYKNFAYEDYMKFSLDHRFGRPAINYRATVPKFRR